MASQPDETIAINLPPSIKERTRVLKSGKTQTRFSIEVKSEPIIHAFYDKELGRKPAEVLVALLQENIRAFARPVAPTTQKKRQHAAAAFDRRASWAMERYSGGGGRRPGRPPQPLH